MDQPSRGTNRPKLSTPQSDQWTVEHQRPPERVWVSLTHQQQHQVFQTIVWLCHQLLQNHNHNQEVEDEPIE